MTEEVGFVKSARGKIVYLDGFPTVAVGERVMGENGAEGYVGGLFPDRVEVHLLTDHLVAPGLMFRRTGEFMTMSVGDSLLGRVVSPLGQPLDGKPSFALRASAGKDQLQVRLLDQPIVGIQGRRFISEQFDTGISVVDTVFPLGKGQRELIIGESRAGKAAFLQDLITNQKGRGVVCVYGMIGKPMAGAKDIWTDLADSGVMEHAVIVASVSTDPAPLIFLTAAAAMTVAEFFQRQGKDILLILDDMGGHARNYREMSLISDRPPGRESYPGDIFYQQARLLERAGCFNEKAGGGSITALPVIELTLPDFTGFIPTNLMGMTDGHLLFEAALSQQGRRPAIDLFLSVTRVGLQTQQRIQNLLAMKLKEILAMGAQLEIVSRFASELPPETKLILSQMEQIEEQLTQETGLFIPKEVQTILLALPLTTFLRGKGREFIRGYQKKLVEAFGSDPELRKFAAEVFAKKTIKELVAALETVKPRLEEITGIGEVTETAGMAQGAGQEDPAVYGVAKEETPVVGMKKLKVKN